MVIYLSNVLKIQIHRFLFDKTVPMSTRNLRLYQRVAISPATDYCEYKQAFEPELPRL